MPFIANLGRVFDTTQEPEIKRTDMKGNWLLRSNRLSKSWASDRLAPDPQMRLLLDRERRQSTPARSGRAISGGQ